ncbi:MAG: HAMP domain-containing histidine kinase [Ignavibacteriales bacterium]|nr:HAMP domain-containing histidine kinase [Ignavibacteriales bacterium]
MISQIANNIVLPFHTLETFRTRIMWYINLRWLAVFGILISVLLGQEILGFDIAISEITLVCTFVACFNIISFLIAKYMSCKNVYREFSFAESQIVGDLIAVSFLVHYAGGISNPLFFIYIVQVIFSGILFPGFILTLINTIFSSLLLTIWSLLEFNGYIPNHFFHPETITLPYLIISLIAFNVTNFTVFYIIKDFMHHFRHMKRQLDLKNAQLEDSIKERNRIFRFAAHELKSPIVAVQSTLAVIRSLHAEELNSEVADLIQKAEKRSEQILDMIKEMIEVTKYTLEYDDRFFEEVNFVDWLNDTIDLDRPYAKKKEIDLQVVKIDEKIIVKIDKIDIEKVVINLVNNALRYTPIAGKVTVTPFIDKEYFGFSIKDTGIGISKVEIEKIFEEFYRTKKAKEMERIGTGLGLSLVKQIVKNNGGEIIVQSKVGKGSTFIVKLPIHFQKFATQKL